MNRQDVRDFAVTVDAGIDTSIASIQNSLFKLHRFFEIIKSQLVRTRKLFLVRIISSN